MSTRESGASVASDVVTRIVTYEVRAGSEAHFNDWQAETNAACSAFPGFLGFQDIPPSGGSGDRQWSLIYRFATSKALDAWLASPIRAQLVAAGRPFVGADPVEHSIAGGSTRGTGATIVASHTVVPGKESEYEAENDRLNAAAAGFPGFVGVQDFPPAKPGGEWTTLVRFRDQPSLDRWMASPERAEGRKALYAFLTAHRTQKVASGFGSWFAVNAEDSLASPTWKQNMAVLLGLFPTVMALNLTLGSLLTGDGVPFALNVFVGNLVGTLILSLLLMPLITRGLDWWLKPSCPAPRSWLGAGLILAGYAAELAFFLYVWH